MTATSLKIQLAQSLKNAKVVGRPANESALHGGNGNSNTANGGASVSNGASKASHSSQNKSSDIEQLLGTISSQIEELEERRINAIGELRQLALEIALAATAKIFMQEIEADRFPLDSIISSMIESCQDEQIQILLNPVDCRLVNESAASSKSSMTNQGINLVADPSIARGTCRLESKRFDLIRNPLRQIEEIRQSVMENMNDASTERRNTNSSRSHLQRFPDRRSAG